MLNLNAAWQILQDALSHATGHGFKPMAVAVLDARGALMLFAAQDGTSLKRGDIAIAKAQGALALGMGSRALMQRAEAQPYFIAAATATLGGGLIPVPGGVLIRSGGAVVGAVGVSGDSSDHDEDAAIAGITAAGFEADGG